ncbi:hypothetical protein [Rachiplusia nu nucleopolyhedrovirus]|uniref:Uncharacterized protein n=1 Tax=Rachiplusia nu nucleopolyhedrovirus TaxID=2605775 RepID=A0AAF1DB30_9ABAC|nr:hypothetical protein QKQ55_gp049 [Rachiplusia nu nucleopolyhedrovirus]QEI03599.1 hypothetical protein [Rachiplusia nu nucleopolyhedrovirus]
MAPAAYSSLSARFLEFEQVCLDLRYVTFMQDFYLDSRYICCYNNSPAVNNVTSEYIIFLNVHKAIFCNFKISSDMSLETLTEYVYDNVRFTIEDKLIQKPPFSKCTTFIENDDKNSIIIDLHPLARVVIARVIFPNERYHQRISGYIDFENRLRPGYCVMDDDKERARKDREYEINLLGLT